ncbi:cytochrome P450 [Dactylonectria macrodidyma]|uniref:Cytochrome P450 n=1 Tax=Dactylonectria macrodidyma TaxID=307937 RepID=A0A9P9J1B0_9HYPO|nr:cytochrome P450 [Dactylonectria macrodidyma]
MTHVIKTQLQVQKDCVLSGETKSGELLLGPLGLVDSGAVSNDDIISVIGFTVGAGCSDGSTWLTAVLYYLLKHPDKYKKLMEELHEKAADGKLGPIAKAREAAEFSYLNAVLHQSLRLRSTLVSNTPREVHEGGLELDGGHVPKGTIVGCPAWVIHRLPEVWGEDAEAFIPERWIELENKAVLHRYFMGFGSGSRTCLGRNISFLEARKLVPSILMAYDSELADPKGWELTGG